MSIKATYVTYIPFRRKPFGHVSVIFETMTGESFAISPEAKVREGSFFSLISGLFRTYRLHYVVEKREAHVERYHRAGRRVHEYPLELNESEQAHLYASMMSRARNLSTKHEWYNSLSNSCITNVVAHVDEARAYVRPFHEHMLLTFVPQRVRFGR